ncbi:MAG: uracil-DNA glycosylase [Gammaproteobacteria bacterium]
MARSFTATQRACLQALELPVWQRREWAMDESVVEPVVVEPNMPESSEASSQTLSPRLDPQTLDWPQLRQAVLSCAQCDLQQTRTQAVFGVGVATPELVVVGEAPGAEEDRTGEPFVGRAGQLLDRMLAAIDCARTQNVFITNVLKCRPPNNRDPHVNEIAACRGWLLRQLELLQPKAILCVGRFAAQTLLETDQPLSRLRGPAQSLRVSSERTVPVFVTYHPAYLLRTPADKAKAWVDLKNLRAALRARSGNGS